MSEPVSNCTRGTESVRQQPSSLPNGGWFRTRLGRRYGLEIALVLGAKLALLFVLWLIFIQPWPRPEAPPTAIVQTFYMPASPAPHHD